MAAHDHSGGCGDRSLFAVGRTRTAPDCPKSQLDWHSRNASETDVPAVLLPFVIHAFPARSGVSTHNTLLEVPHSRRM